MMNIYVVLVKDSSIRWRFMTRKKDEFHQRLCTYETHEGAEKAINSMKYRFSKNAEFRIAEYGEIKNKESINNVI